jgi:DNA-binding NarL/FixJ family response regulator
LSACLISGHALVLHELQRIVEALPCTVTAVKPSDSARLSAASIPACSVYIIDSENLPGGVLEGVEAVLANAKSPHILVLVDDLTEAATFPLLNLGVQGLLKHDVLESQLLRALAAVAAGGYWVPRTLLASFVESVVARSRRAEKTKLSTVKVSRREMDIVDGLLANLSNKEIATKHNISERTVKFHVSNLLAKFKVRRRADLLLLWYQHGAEGAGSAKIVPADNGRLQ